MNESKKKDKQYFECKDFIFERCSDFAHGHRASPLLYAQLPANIIIANLKLFLYKIVSPIG